MSVIEGEGQGGAPLTELEQVGDYLVDPATGEVMDVVKPEPAFCVDSQERLEWFQRKWLEAEALVESISSRPEVIEARAVFANSEALKRQARQRLERLRWRFEAEVRDFVARETAGGKSRTLKTIYGSVGLRRVPERLKVANGPAAIRACRENPALHSGLIIEVALFELEQLEREALLSSLDGIPDETVDYAVSTSRIPREAYGAAMSNPYAFALEPEHDALTIKSNAAAEGS